MITTRPDREDDMTHPVGVKPDAVPPAADPPEIDDLDHDRRRRHTRIWVGG